MGRPIKKGSTDQSTVIRIIDSTTGLPENAVEHNTSGIDLWWRREKETKTSITEVALAALDSAHSDGGIKLIGDGYYRLDLPDAAVVAGSGENGVMVGGTVTGMIVIGCYIPLVDYDPYDSVRAGLTALPNATADAAGGLPISNAGGLDIDAKLANTNEVTAARMGALTDWINGGRLDLLLDAIPTTAMRGTDNAALASVVGALNDAAADGDPTTTDTAMKYVKQLINILIGTSGVVVFPAEAAPTNAVSLAEVIRAIHADVTGLNGSAMVGTNNAALASGVDVIKIHGTAINESSAGRIAGNFTTFWDNADAITAKTVDDIGAPASGGGSPLILGAGDVGDFKKNGVVHFFWNTIDRSGAAAAPSTAGTLRIYVDDGTGEITAPTGITDTRAFDGVTGLHECKVSLNSATQGAYAIGKNYSVILVGAVIDTKTVNAKIGSFSIENRWANVHWEYGGK